MIGVKKVLLLLATSAFFAGCNGPEKTSTSVTSITLDKSEMTLVMSVNEEGTLTATVLPEKATNKNFTWMSSKPSVADVDNNGVVTAYKDGTAVIVVTTQEGEFTDECVVTVKPIPIPPTSVTLDKEMLILGKGQNVTLKATVLPERADDLSCTWRSLNTAVATVDENGIVTGVGNGNTKIEVKTVMGDQIDECTVNVEGVFLNGVIWAECNVDMPGTFTDSPEKVGMYYKWGSKIGWSSTDPIINSNGESNWTNDAVEGSTSWAAADDPCPTGWRVPITNDMILLTFSDPSGQQLDNNGHVRREPTTMNGILGCTFTNMAAPEASIFLPTDGYRVGISPTNGGFVSKSDLATMKGASMYWTSSFVTGTTYEAHRLSISRSKNDDGTIRMSIDPFAIIRRSFALPVRCVRITN